MYGLEPSLKVFEHYGINSKEWLKKVNEELLEYTDRKVIFRSKPGRTERMSTNTLDDQLRRDKIFCTITFASVAGLHSVMAGVPSIVLGPSASDFLSNKKISDIENPYFPDDDKIKNHILQKSVFAVAKSGTVSLEISNAKIPSIILYKMGLINFMIVKSLVKTKYANIINFAANEEIIPELLQSNCNSKNIFKHVSNFLEDPNKIKEQVNKVQNVLNKLKTNGSSSELASLSLNKFL